MSLRGLGGRLARAVAAPVRRLTHAHESPARAPSPARPADVVPPSPARPGAARPRPAPPPGTDALAPAADDPTVDYPVAVLGLPTLRYDPRPDGRADPGEVVWAWVPYEEDPTQGKDRPVLVVGTAGPRLVGLMLTSRDNDHRADDEARRGRYWMDVGTGGWDRRRRPSEVRLDRVLSLPVNGVRREGAALDPDVFAAVVARLRQVHPGGPSGGARGRAASGW